MITQGQGGRRSPGTTSKVVDRARLLPATDRRVRGVVLYGSVAKNETHEHSDVDLVIVAEPGQRDGLWADREQVAAWLLDSTVEWSHALPWHGRFRYQAWRSDLLAVDLTVDEGEVEPHEVFTTGAPVVLVGELVLPQLPERSAEIDESQTWVWLLGIHNQIQRGRLWDAYVQLVTLLDVRIAPVVDGAVLTRLVPLKVDRPCLLASLAVCARAFDDAAGPGRPAAPLADAIRNVINTAT